jgi:hypothetical protein
MRTYVVAVLVLVAVSACAPRYKGPDYAFVYIDPNNKDCQLWGASNGGDYDSASNTGQYAKNTRGWVRMVMCGRPDPRLHAPDLSLQDDPVIAAGMVSACVALERCDPADPTKVRWNWVAATWDQAMRVEPSVVEAGLATIDLPAYMKRDFVTRYRAARERIFEIVKAQGKPWRELFLKPALQARADRAAADEVLSPWQERVAEVVLEADAAVLAKDVDSNLVEKVLALRREYIAECRKVRKDVEFCLGDQHGFALTAAIARMIDGGGFEALRAAEYHAQNVQPRIDPRIDERIAAEAALLLEHERYAEYKAAVDAGLSAEVIASKWPTPPVDLTDVHAVIGHDWQVTNHTAYGSGHGGDVSEVYDEVRQIKRNGKKATILFEKDVYVGWEATGCRETNKIDGVDEYGHLIYRTVCTGPDRKYTDDRTTKPVTVPWAEVSKVKPGELIHVYVDSKSRKGHVGWVGTGRKKDDKYTRDTPRIQVREFRL